VELSAGSGVRYRHACRPGRQDRAVNASAVDRYVFGDRDGAKELESRQLISPLSAVLLIAPAKV
jgi:hypothetical protein